MHFMAMIYNAVYFIIWGNYIVLWGTAIYPIASQLQTPVWWSAVLFMRYCQGFEWAVNWVAYVFLHLLQSGIFLTIAYVVAWEPLLVPAFVSVAETGFIMLAALAWSEHRQNLRGFLARAAYISHYLEGCRFGALAVAIGEAFKYGAWGELIVMMLMNIGLQATTQTGFTSFVIRKGIQKLSGAEPEDEYVMFGIKCSRVFDRRIMETYYACVWASTWMIPCTFAGYFTWWVTLAGRAETSVYQYLPVIIAVYCVQEILAELACQIVDKYAMVPYQGHGRVSFPKLMQAMYQTHGLPTVVMIVCTGANYSYAGFRATTKLNF